jgi:hypothetical protein
MIEFVDLWFTLLAFILSFGAGYMFFTYRGLRANRQGESLNYLFFTGITGAGGLTFFLSVLARISI